jgi:DNA invertase Pin-like site-specific DNA recombinase
MTKRVGLYLRVSTDEQTVENQERELTEAAQRAGWQIVAVFKDEGISGSKGREQRPAFDDLHKAVVRREIDLVAAWSVDRLGRSMQDLVPFLAEVHGVGCALYLHKQALDTTTPAGKAMFNMMGVFAEFERDMIRERVRAGVRRAKLQGTKSGRPSGRPPIAPDVRNRISEVLKAGGSVRKTAAQFQVSASTVQAISAAGA